MNSEKFLTVYAVLDEASQEKLFKLQNKLINAKLNGTQTMGIPFHISLGSYKTEYKDELINIIKDVCLNFKPFEIETNGLNDFNNKVLFLEPKINNDILKLREIFNSDYPNKFPYHPHITIFMGNERVVIKAKEILKEEELLKNVTVIGLEMGEFFPPKILITKNFS